jgi:O-antigen/teichoic acid export membrane protein
LPIPFAYALFAGIALFVAADYLPFLLGESYADAVSALRWLAWLPVVSMPRLFLQTALVGSDHQMQAVAILTFGAVLNIALNVWIIPLWGWLGAVAATYAAEIVMAFAMLLVAWRRSNH